MAADRPKNLETHFKKLCLASDSETEKLPGRLANVTDEVLLSRRRSRFSPSDKDIRLFARIRRFACYLKMNSATSRSVLRPARLNVPSLSKKSIRIRPSKLHVKEPNILLLKPATLIVKDESKPFESSKFGVPSASLPGVPFSVGQVFSIDKLNSQKSFKSLKANVDPEITNAFDPVSFKKLRHTKDPPASEVLAAHKREYTSSCSVQANMEPSVPDHCDDDTSIEELASYFDLFVHIPKKMSTMAEMMYI